MTYPWISSIKRHINFIAAVHTMQVFWRVFEWDRRVADSYGFWVLAVMMALSIGVGIFFHCHLPVADMYVPDSLSYIHFDSSRTVGYPLILWGIEALTGRIENIVTFQWALYASALCFAAFQLMRLLRCAFLPLLYVIFFLCNPYVINFCFLIITEALSLSLVFMMMGLIARWLRLRTYGTWVAMGLFLGMALLLRPVFYGLWVSILIFLWIIRQLNVKTCVPLGVALGISILMGSGMHYVKHGFFGTQAFAGHNLIGKMAMAMQPPSIDVEPETKEAWECLYERLRPLQEEVLKVEGLRYNFMFYAPVYDVLRYQILPDCLHHSLFQVGSVSQKDDAYRKVAMAMLKQNPKGYIWDVFVHYTALWFLLDLKTHEEHKTFLQGKENMAKVLKAKNETFDIDLVYPEGRVQKNLSPWVVWGIRLFLAISWGISLWVTGVGLISRWRPCRDFPWLPLVVMMAVGTQAIYFLTALLQAAFARYALVMWPYVVAMPMVYTYHLLCQRKKLSNVD